MPRPGRAHRGLERSPPHKLGRAPVLVHLVQRALHLVQHLAGHGRVAQLLLAGLGVEVGVRLLDGSREGDRGVGPQLGVQLGGLKDAHELPGDLVVHRLGRRAHCRRALLRVRATQCRQDVRPRTLGPLPNRELGQPLESLESHEAPPPENEVRTDIRVAARLQLLLGPRTWLLSAGAGRAQGKLVRHLQVFRGTILI